MSRRSIAGGPRTAPNPVREAGRDGRPQLWSRVERSPTSRPWPTPSALEALPEPVRPELGDRRGPVTRSAQTYAQRYARQAQVAQSRSPIASCGRPDDEAGHPADRRVPAASKNITRSSAQHVGQVGGHHRPTVAPQPATRPSRVGGDDPLHRRPPPASRKDSGSGMAGPRTGHDWRATGGPLGLLEFAPSGTYSGSPASYSLSQRFDGAVRGPGARPAGLGGLDGPGHFGLAYTASTGSAVGPPVQRTSRASRPRPGPDVDPRFGQVGVGLVGRCPGCPQLYRKGVPDEEQFHQSAGR